MLVLTRKCGESVRVGDNVEITLLKTRRDKARIGITAPGQVILRADAVDRDASPRKVSVMRMDRSMCEVDAKFMADYAEVLMYARAKDGVYVPSCDLAQYEAGKRGVAGVSHLSDFRTKRWMNVARGLEPRTWPGSSVSIHGVPHGMCGPTSGGSSHPGMGMRRPRLVSTSNGQ